MLKGKNVLLGVTGSIAAYKIASLASALVKLHCNVDVIMTENATNFINPITFETLTGNKCLVDTFDRNFQYSVEHVSLAKKADVVLVAPATANFLAKAAYGMADDMLTTTFLACKCPKLISPAMNTNMYENVIVQDNIKRLKSYGCEVIDPACGHLACGDTGAGKMPEPELLLEYILKETAFDKDMKGLKVTVTAGPTREPLDPVRFLSNRSTGKMGYAIARAAMQRGADVTLIAGQTCLADVPFVRMVHIETAKEMFDAVMESAKESDIVIKAAAVADYTPDTVAENKIKKSDSDLSIALKRTDDIIGTLGKLKSEINPKLFLCGFSMETENMLENSRAKLEKKNLDMIVANNVKVEGAGFATDTNVVTIITKDATESLPIMSKDSVAHELLNRILKNIKTT
jgi:phosphopantothenoylcysteine decarboxylase/phosphopantothenate--cysteine ligase